MCKLHIPSALACLGQKLIDDTVPHSGTTVGRPTLFTDGVQLIEDDDV